MLRKRCFKCGLSKLLTSFYAHPMMADGRLGKCKVCTKLDVRANYRANREYYVAYERERFKRPERKLALSRYQRTLRERFPGKDRARTAVSNAIRDGRLVRQPCAICGMKAEAHHEDYRRPLLVRWLCREHHLQHHHGSF